MIGLIQWRACIGLWNHCHVAFHESSNGQQCHSFEAIKDRKQDRKSNNITPNGNVLIQSVTHSFFMLFMMLKMCTLIITHCCSYQTQCTLKCTTACGFVMGMHWLQSEVMPGATVDITSNLKLVFYFNFLLLLSGDIELNPGPVIDEQPSGQLFAELLKSLVDWKAFAHCLPGITQSHINAIDSTVDGSEKKVALCKKWLEINPQASWKDVITALEECREHELVNAIKEKLNKFNAGDGSNMKVLASNGDTISPGKC